MDLFKLSRDFKTNKEWNAILKKPQDEKLNLSSCFANGLQLDLLGQEGVEMELINSRSVKTERTGKLLEADLIYWTDDITLNAFKPSGACYAIVSERLKRLLEEFNFHDHYYYPIVFTNIESNKKHKQYYILHVVSAFDSFTDYSKCTYEYYSYNTKAIIKTEVGSFNSLDELGIESNKAFNEDGVRLTIIERVLDVDYDLIWGISSILYVNNKIKLAVESSDLKGISLTPLKSPKIVLKSEL